MKSIIICLIPLFKAVLAIWSYNSEPIRIKENMPINSKIADLSEYLSFNINPSSFLDISNQGVPGVEFFKIDIRSGFLVIAKPPDRDALCKKSLECPIQISLMYGSRDEPSYSTITIYLEDVNDNPPRFLPTNRTKISIVENSSPGDSRFPLTQAEDFDLGENGICSYELERGSDSYPFNLHPDSPGAYLTLKRPLDREERQNYTFRVLAVDSGTPKLTGTLTVDVIVKDLNDNKPTFRQPSYEATIREDHPLNQKILTVEATDPDQGVHGLIRYSIAPPTNENERLANRFFRVRTINESGVLFIREQLDVDSILTNRLDFRIRATDGGDQSSAVLVTIRITDVNDDAPEIFIYYNNADNSKLRGFLLEEEDRKTIGQVTVQDRDSGLGGEVACNTSDSRFSLVELPSNDPSLRPKIHRMYRLINVVRLDREVTKTVHFKVICTDNVQLQGQIGARILTGSAIVRIVIKDKNDMAPEFTSHPYNFELPEGEPELGYDRRYSLGRVVARDRDEGVNAELTYSIVPGNPLNHHFVIDSRTGALYAVQSFDRETIKSVSLLVQVVDGGKENVHTASVDVKIEIVDKNDCAPQFQLSNNQMEVEENVLNGRVGHLLATDMDDNANFKKIIYRLENSLDGSHFIIDSQSGDIRVRGRLDRETRNHYEFKVFAIDNPDGQLSDQNTGTATVIVTVLDQNDNAPVFEYPSDNKKIILRSDESTAGITAFKAKATDADAGNNSTVNYMLEYGGNGIFKMEKVMGICYLNKAPSANSPRSYSLRIRAYDLGTPRSLNSSITVTVVFSQNEVGKYAGEGDFRDDQIDRTIVIVSVTIFLLLLVSTFILVVLIRYRHLFSRGGTRGYRPGHKATVISRCQKAEDDAKTLRSDTYRKTQTALLSPDSTQDEQEDPTYGNRASDIKNSLLPSRWNGDIVGSFLKLSDIDSKNPGNAERMVLANRQHSHFASGENYQTLDAVVSPRGYSPASDDFLATSGPAGLCIANSHTMTPGRDARKNYYYEVATTGSPFRRVHMKQNSLSGGSTGPPSNPYQIYGINSETSQTPSHQSSVGDSATYGRSPKCYVFNNTGSPCLTSKPKVEDSFV